MSNEIETQPAPRHGPALVSRLDPLVEAAKTYARAATSAHTNRAYAADWAREPPERPLPAARRKAVLLRFGLVAAARLARREDPPL